MAQKFVRSLILSGLGLVAVTVGVLAVGQSVATQRQGEMDAIAAEFLAQFPVTEANDSARELDQLALTLAEQPLSPSPVAPDAPATEAPGGLRELVEAYIKEQTQKIRGPLDPVPAGLVQHLQQHEAELAEVKQQLQAGEPPVWDLDPEAMADFSYELPSFMPLVMLHRLLLVEAIGYGQAGQAEAALEAWQTAQLLQQPIAQRPDLMSQLVSLIMLEEQAGLLRHLEGLPLTEPLLGQSDAEAMHRALRFDSWLSYRGLQKVAAGESAAQQAGEEEKLNTVTSLFFRLSAVDTAQVMQDYYDQLGDFNFCSPRESWDMDYGEVAWWNQLGQMTIPAYVRPLGRAHRQMLNGELTQKVLQAKALREDGQWPEQLSGLESQVCPGERWVYAVTPEGKMSLAFSYKFEGYEFEDGSDEGALPLRYEAE